MKRSKHPRHHPSQAAAGTIPRPTCCTNCQRLYDAVQASHAALTALGAPWAPDVDALYAALRQPTPCLLCEHLTVVMGRMFLPHGGLWRGQGILYFLCQTCEMLPAATRELRVEAMVMAAVVGHQN